MKVCRDSRRSEATEETGPDIKSCGQVGNQPTCVHDCYSTAAGYQLPITTHCKCDSVTGSDVIEHEAAPKRKYETSDVR